jgi:hypothetical protein
MLRGQEQAHAWTMLISTPMMTFVISPRVVLHPLIWLVF